MPLNKAVKQSNDNLLTPYITIASNVTQLGTSVTPPNRGATTAYPTTAAIGDQFFDSTTNELKVFTVNGWVSAGTAPNAPTNVTVTSSAAAYGGLPGVVVSWTPASTGVPASSYTVTSSPGGITQTTTGNTVSILGLTSGTAYTFTVAAKNSFGSASTVSSSITPVTVPQSASNVVATGYSGSASVSFTPGDTAGTTPTYYVYSNPGLLVGSGASSPITVSGLTVGTNYTFTVFAVNAAGSSLVSPTSNSVTAAVLATGNIVLNLDAQNGVSAGGENIARVSNNPTNTTYWAYGGATVTSSTAVTNPSGGAPGVYKITEDTSNGQHLISQTPATTVTVGDIWEISGYFKAGERNIVALTSHGGSYPAFNLTTGTLVTNGGGVYPDYSGDVYGHTITPAGNGWYYCSVIMKRTIAVGASYIVLSSASTTFSNNYTGTTGSGLYIYDFQIRRTATSAPGFVSNPNTTAITVGTSTWNDLSGNAFNGTNNNSSTYAYTSAVYGAAGLGYYAFNGTNQQFTFTNSPNVQFLGTSPYTMEVWGYVTSNPPSNTYPGFMNHEDSSLGYRDGYNTYFVTGDQINIAYSSDRWAGNSFWNTGAVFPIGSIVGVWKHYVATYDPTIQKLTLYVNGAQVSQSTAINNIANSTVTLVLANRGGNFLPCRISRAKIYSRTLSANDVAGNYFVQKSTYGL